MDGGVDQAVTRRGAASVAGPSAKMIPMHPVHRFDFVRRVIGSRWAVGLTLLLLVGTVAAWALACTTTTVGQRLDGSRIELSSGVLRLWTPRPPRDEREEWVSLFNPEEWVFPKLRDGFSCEWAGRSNNLPLPTSPRSISQQIRFAIDTCRSYGICLPSLHYREGDPETPVFGRRGPGWRVKDVCIMPETGFAPGNEPPGLLFFTIHESYQMTPEQQEDANRERKRVLQMAFPDLILGKALVVPFWPFVFLFAILLRLSWRARRRLRRRLAGRCELCEYDLRGGDSGNCPECGRRAHAESGSLSGPT